MGVRVKVCCIASAGEAQLAIAHGASAVGLVSAMPSGPGVIPEDTIAQIAATIPPGVDSFLLTSLQDPAAIVLLGAPAPAVRVHARTPVAVTRPDLGRPLYGRRSLPIASARRDDTAGEV